MTHERHIGSFSCYLLVNVAPDDLILTFGKQKRLPERSTPLFGTMELDQREANVCIRQDTNTATEVPFKTKYSGLKPGRKESERKEIKKYNYINPSFGKRVEKKIYCILL